MCFQRWVCSPCSGRTFTYDEDYGGKAGVIVLSFEYWQARIGGRADVLGTPLATDGGPKTIVGVMPPGFTVAGQKADFFIPFAMTVAAVTRVPRPRQSRTRIARVRDGVTFEQAVTEMRTIFAQRVREAPELNARRTVVVIPLQEQMVGDVRPALLALMGAVGLVLLVACVNVASLLLARSAAREREFGMRTAFGARRAQTRSSDADREPRRWPRSAASPDSSSRHCVIADCWRSSATAFPSHASNSSSSISRSSSLRWPWRSRRVLPVGIVPAFVTTQHAE